MSDRQLDEIRRKEDLIAAQQKRIEEAERRIEHEERRILDAENAILKHNEQRGLGSLFDKSLTPPERYFVRMRVIKRLAKHKLVFSLLITTGIVLVWRGIWHLGDVFIWPGNQPFPFDYFTSGVLSFFLGVAILWLIDRYTDLSK